MTSTGAGRTYMYMRYMNDLLSGLTTPHHHVPMRAGWVEV